MPRQPEGSQPPAVKVEPQVQATPASETKGKGRVRKEPALTPEQQQALKLIEAQKAAMEAEAKAAAEERMRQNDLLAELGKIFPDYSEIFIGALARGENASQVIQRAGRSMIESSSLYHIGLNEIPAPEQQARQTAGYDLQIAGITLEMNDVYKTMQAGGSKRKQNELQARWYKLNNQLQTCRRERAEFRNKNNLKNLPNQMEKFAKALGVTDREFYDRDGNFIEDYGLVAARGLVDKAIANPELWKAMTDKLVNDKICSEEQIKKLNEFKESDAAKKALEKRLKFGKTALATSSLLMLLMLYISSKEGQGGGMMGGH